MTAPAERVLHLWPDQRRYETLAPVVVCRGRGDADPWNHDGGHDRPWAQHGRPSGFGRRRASAGLSAEAFRPPRVRAWVPVQVGAQGRAGAELPIFRRSSRQAHGSQWRAVGHARALRRARTRGRPIFLCGLGHGPGGWAALFVRRRVSQNHRRCARAGTARRTAIQRSSGRSPLGRGAEGAGGDAGGDRRPVPVAA